MYLILSYNGKQLTVTKKTKPEDVIGAFGIPTTSWGDEVEKSLKYQSATQNVEFIFGVDSLWRKPGGKLKYVEIEAKP